MKILNYVVQMPGEVRTGCLSISSRDADGNRVLSAGIRVLAIVGPTWDDREFRALDRAYQAMPNLPDDVLESCRVVAERI